MSDTYKNNEKPQAEVKTEAKKETKKDNSENSIFRKTKMFTALSHRNYKFWFAGTLVSNIGTWIQRTSQSWLVMSVLSQNSATDVGIIIALQFFPQIFVTPFAGYIVDRVRIKRLLILTQILSASISFTMAWLIYTNSITMGYVQVLALLFGIVSGVDAPARQSFVSKLVGKRDLSNAVSLNSLSFNLGRLVGPAVAGILIACIGFTLSFVCDATSYIFFLLMLLCIRTSDLIIERDRKAPPVTARDSVRYVRMRTDLLAIMSIIFFINAFGSNFDIFLSKFSLNAFGAESSAYYGTLTLFVSIGSLLGAINSARKEIPTLRFVAFSACSFGLGLCALGFATEHAGSELTDPFMILVFILLPFLGFFLVSAFVTSMTYVQCTTDTKFLARVLAIYIAVQVGSRPLASPFIGFLSDLFGNGASMAIAGAFIIAIVVYIFWKRRKYISKEEVIDYLHLTKLADIKGFAHVNTILGYEIHFGDEDMNRCMSHDDSEGESEKVGKKHDRLIVLSKSAKEDVENTETHNKKDE